MKTTATKISALAACALAAGCSGLSKPAERTFKRFSFDSYWR